ncbi:CRAL/TRIO domain-containing protein [Thelephora ganbajun]|uniref:CRAL/TRIO domain-containing protein n=1 Tax=Thelephora ganbajun TaxID=370292 RepID=A0ACB6ZXW1_THEGA|nr:CRAL/TRIO domain-containing protein [Thelephora ganbajun]
MSSMKCPVDLSDMFRVLPSSCRDPLGRPTLVFNLSVFFELASRSLDDTKDLILWLDDTMRWYLRKVSKESGQRTPVLQFVAIVNVQGVTLSSSVTDLVTWYYQDVQPHYPGMMGAVFIQGHSWTHSRMWNVLKRVLPKSAQNKVSFFSREELVDYFGANALPEDFGGSLPASSTLQDPFFEQLPSKSLRSRSLSSSERSLPQLQTPEPGPSNLRPQARLPTRLDTSVPAVYSPFNPFFGYPVSPTSLNPRYGRRRKRDLLRTLAYLWWAKWKGTAIWVAMVILVFWFTRWRLRMWLNRRRQMVIQRTQ